MAGRGGRPYSVANTWTYDDGDTVSCSFNHPSLHECDTHGLPFGGPGLEQRLVDVKHCSYSEFNGFSWYGLTIHIIYI